MRKTAVILALVILAACASGTRQDNVNYRTGSEGLYLQFTPNAPPTIVYDDQRLDVMIEVENRGATNVGGAGDRIYLSGFEPRIITGIPYSGKQIPAMNGKDQYGPGDRSFVTFQGIPVSLTALNVDKYLAPLQITACYEYDTVGTANVCIDPDPHSQTGTQKVCTPTNVGMGSQGAPVAVTNVKVNPSPGTTRFEFEISNVGNGKPFRSGAQYLQKCSPYDQVKLEYNEIDYVQLLEVNIAGRSIKGSCRPTDRDHVRLINGHATIYCQYTGIPGNAAYMTPITISLRYGYQQIERRDVTLVQSG